MKPLDEVIGTVRGLYCLTAEGSAEFKTDTKLLSKFIARPEDATPFNVYYELGNGQVLVPRYTLHLSACRHQLWKTRYPDTSKPMLFGGTLREFQQTAVSEMAERLVESNGVILRADCGTGKSVMALAVIAKLGIQNVIILVDQANLAEQWVERIEQFLGVDSVIFSGDEENIDNIRHSVTPIKIVMAQSLMRRDWKNDPIRTDLLIVDEAHVFSAPCFSAAIANIDFIYSMGLTATPYRRDKLEWIFQDILGSRTVEVTAKAMTSEVRIFHLPFVDISSEDYRFWWCRVTKKSVWAAKCPDCKWFDQYPNCGGVGPKGKRINMAAMMSRLVEDEEYTAWLHAAIAILAKKNRQILVFSHLRSHLKNLYQTSVEKHGEEKCGLYIGVQSKDDEVKRQVAMQRQITFCTYGVANKALDVPHKDAIVFATPRSDIQQAKGRIERVHPNKPLPLVIDPTFDHIELFKFMGFARRKKYRASGCTIKDYNVEPNNDSNSTDNSQPNG